MSSAPQYAPSGRRVERHSTWTGDISWRHLSQRREALFDDLEAADCWGVSLDVRTVTSIDRPGVALLIGANYRAGATGRRLVLIDSHGPVTSALARMNLIGNFLVTQIPPETRTATRRPSRLSTTA
jgi:anti-anti-sigma regulatory factor